jgi:hypothetical protein
MFVYVVDVWRWYRGEEPCYVGFGQALGTTGTCQPHSPPPLSCHHQLSLMTQLRLHGPSLLSLSIFKWMLEALVPKQHICVSLLNVTAGNKISRFFNFFFEKDRPIVCRGSESKFKIYLKSISREKYHVLPLHPCCRAFIKSGPTISHVTKKAKWGGRGWMQSGSNVRDWEQNRSEMDGANFIEAQMIWEHMILSPISRRLLLLMQNKDSLKIIWKG